MADMYACTQCDWEYEWPMGDRVKAVKRHQLGHLLEEHGWTGAVEDVLDSIVIDQAKSQRDKVPAHAFFSQYLDERLKTSQWL